MTANDDDHALGTEDLYHRAYHDLNQLQTHLPQDVVASLAREVLRRMAREVSEPKVSPKEIRALSEALIDKNAKAASKLIESYLAGGVNPVDIYVNYLGPAAHRLGVWWERDEVTFANVTVGTGRIYAIMRTLRHRMPITQLPEARSAFFAAVPDDDHKLGVKMAADLFRKQGWEVDLALDDTHDQLVERITTSGHMLIGLSGGGEHALPALARLILALRVSTPNALIMVSGNVVRAAEEKIALMHVDGMALDFDKAMTSLEELWSRLENAKLV
ncbi:MAG: B12-binding domain-containing protein [Sulfitobacter sp.]